MSNFPRRSARLSQQYAQQHINNTSPTSTSSFSPTSTASTSPVNDPTTFVGQQQEHIRYQLQTQFLAPRQHFGAPLPSPSASEPGTYFDRALSHNSFPMSQQTQQSNTQQVQQTQQNQYGYNSQMQNQTQQQTQHHNSFSQSQSQRPANLHGNSYQTQGQLPPDFLAEAAKRAQMACLMRDLGDVSL